MNDTLRLANDSLNITLTNVNKVAEATSETTLEDVFYVYGVLFILLVIAVSIYYGVKVVVSSITEIRKASFKHEEEMQKLNRIKEERKDLLKFCYNLAQKKESETKEASQEAGLPLDKVRQECWQIIKQMNEVDK